MDFSRGYRAMHVSAIEGEHRTGVQSKEGLDAQVRSDGCRTVGLHILIHIDQGQYTAPSTFPRSQTR